MIIMSIMSYTGLDKIATHTISHIKTLLDGPYLQWTQTEFIQLQNLAECPLTLVNAHGEAARLTNWKDAENDMWL